MYDRIEILTNSIDFVCICLVGEAAGKAPFGVAKKEEVNMNQLRGKVDSATGVVNDTRMVSLASGVIDRLHIRCFLLEIT